MPKCPKCLFQWVSTIRSNPQNNFYWGVPLEIISEHTGFTTQEVHEILKNKFLKTIKVINNLEYHSSKSTTELTTGEFKRYIEDIQQWASEVLGVIIPDPDPCPIREP